MHMKTTAVPLLRREIIKNDQQSKEEVIEKKVIPYIFILFFLKNGRGVAKKMLKNEG